MCLIGLSESGHGGRFDPCEECKRLQEENEALRAAISPIIRHADAPDTAPPLRLSVQDCRKIKESTD